MWLSASTTESKHGACFGVRDENYCIGAKGELPDHSAELPWAFGAKSPDDCFVPVYTISSLFECGADAGVVNRHSLLRFPCACCAYVPELAFRRTERRNACYPGMMSTLLLSRLSINFRRCHCIPSPSADHKRWSLDIDSHFAGSGS